ncbi:MAG: glycosyltransferase, partial [Rhodanobacteraceae bacterium]
MPTPKPPISVLHVVDSLETGGLERVVADLAVAQRRAGHRVAVFSIQRTDGFRQTIETAGIPVLVGDKRGTLDRAVLRRLRAAMREHRIEIVHSHNFVPNYYAALAMLALPCAPALVNTCHNMGTRLSQRRLRWLYRASLLRTAGVAMVSRQVRERLVGSGLVRKSRAVTVLNGIPIERFGNSASRRACARHALGLETDALVIGCVGRLVPVKNHALLVAQVPGLLRKHPTLHIVLIGDGPLEDKLRAQTEALGASERVHFAGARADVADLLPAFDIFAQPSLSEGLSIALLEACATGLAVVASAVGGNPEIIHDGNSGLVV